MIPHLLQDAIAWDDRRYERDRWDYRWARQCFIARIEALQLHFTGRIERRESRQKLHRDRRRIADLAMTRKARRNSLARRWSDNSVSHVADGVCSNDVR